MCRQQGLSAVPAEDLSLWGSLEVLLSHASSACFNLIDSIPREEASSDCVVQGPYLSFASDLAKLLNYS